MPLEVNEGYVPLVRKCDDPLSNFAKIRRSQKDPVTGKVTIQPEKKSAKRPKFRLIDIMELDEQKP